MIEAAWVSCITQALSVSSSHAVYSLERRFAQCIPCHQKGILLSRQGPVKNLLYVQRLKAWTRDLTQTCPSSVTSLKEKSRAAH